MATSRHWCLLLLVTLFTFFSSLSALAAVSDKPPFYKISYQGKSAYLLGSIHVGRDDFYPMASQIEDAFAQAGALVVEADINSADMSELIRRYGMTAVEQDSETKQRMESYCQIRQPVCNALASYSPWMQAMQLTMFRFEGIGYQAQWGVDQMLMQQNRNRLLIELESTEFQLKLMSSFSPKAQWDMVIEAIDVPDSEMLTLINAWRLGDENTLDELLAGQMQNGEDTELIEKMLWRRNIDMSHKIAQLMADKEIPSPLFIVVGAGHVVGDKGIPIKMNALYQAKIQNCWTKQCI